MRLIRRASASFTGLLLAASCSGGNTPEPKMFTHASILDSLLVQFRKVRADADSVALVALERGPRGDGPMGYAVIAVAYSPGGHEQFGVFLVNSQLNRATRTFDIFPTPRSHDYEIWFVRTYGDSIIICGRGFSYGDQTLRRAYAVESGPVYVAPAPPPGEEDGMGSSPRMRPDPR